jgi:hypothetical protein
MCMGIEASSEKRGRAGRGDACQLPDEMLSTPRLKNCLQSNHVDEEPPPTLGESRPEFSVLAFPLPLVDVASSSS